MKRLFLISVVACLLYGCEDSSTFRLSRLEGNWYCKQEDGTVLIETWESSEDHILKGTGKEVIEGKEHPTEFLEIKKENDSYLYVATVPDQNEGEPVTFTSVAMTPSSIRFENKSHDFPQYVFYELIDDINMKVTIGDLKGNSFEMNFSKKQPLQ